MKELKCPQCGSVFSVDSHTFDSIAEQVKSAAFDEELARRENEIKTRLSAEFKLNAAKQQKEFDQQLALQHQRAADYDAKIALLQQQLQQQQKLKDAEIQAAVNNAENQFNKSIADKQQQIAKMQSLIDNANNKQTIALMEQRRISDEQIRLKENTIRQLEADIQKTIADNAATIATIKEAHARDIAAKDREIQFHKDYKMSLSTKMIGESLEIHCATEFAKAQSMGMFPNATFDKDNDVRTGTKGDFIFRDFAQGNEYVSIMFEMKNESDTPGVKHRNDDFLEKLNKDRNDKHCEYAVLVSMLEKDNELYNNGIVNKSYIHPKMFVIRPQMFIAFIALICQTSAKNLNEIAHLRQQLEQAQRQHLDVTNFENRRDKFAETFSKLVNAHIKKQSDALEGIDKVIDSLEKQAETLRKVKTLFEASAQKLNRANEAVENDFTIKKLTWGNPTMKALFDQARQNNSETDNIMSNTDN